MIRYERRAQILAILLAMLAGFVDATGFLKMGGLFVSFMSGNSTRLAVSIAEGSTIGATAGLLIGAFVAGVVIGSLVSAAVGTQRKAAVLALVSVLLFLATGLDVAGGDLAAVGVMALAMGCANTVFQRNGEVSIGVTYMTGTLVKLGQRIAGAFLGDNPTAWLPYLLLWMGLVGGAVAGAAGYAQFGLNCLAIAAVFSGLLAVWARTIGPRPIPFE